MFAGLIHADQVYAADPLSNGIAAIDNGLPENTAASPIKADFCTLTSPAATKALAELSCNNVFSAKWKAATVAASQVDFASALAVAFSFPEYTKKCASFSAASTFGNCTQITANSFTESYFSIWNFNSVLSSPAIKRRSEPSTFAVLKSKLPECKRTTTGNCACEGDTPTALILIFL